MPIYAAIFMVFTMANVGLPGTSGFVGEFLTLLAAFKVNPTVSLFATLGVILSATYALWLYRRMIFGVLEKRTLQNILDVTPREIAIFVPLVFLTILFGVWPNGILDMSASSVTSLVDHAHAAIGAMHKTAMLMGGHP
jgi:NADH-quinone oxidoreductase subunit M